MNIPHYIKLPDRITLQDPPDVQTAGGGWTDDWTSFKSNVKAAVIPTNAEEFVIGEKLQTVMMYSVIIEASVKGVVPEQRILWGAHELYITGVMPEIAGNGVQVVTARERQYMD